MLHCWVSLLLMLCICCSYSLQTTRIGIIGAGIGGASCSYYTSKFVNNVNMSIDVFERNDYIGGRLKHINISGIPLNVGGDAWSIVNEYVVELQRELKIPLDNTPSSDGNGKSGIYFGNGQWKQVPSVWLYPLSELMLSVQLEWFRLDLWDNYVSRGKSSFATIEDFVKYGNLHYYTSLPTVEFLYNYGIDIEFADLSLLPLMRVIYDQNLTVSTFASFVSLLSFATEGYSAAGGNDELVKTLFNRSTNLKSLSLSTPIKSITRLSSPPSYLLTTSSGAIQGPFDILILAVPIEFANIEFLNFSISPLSYRHFHHWYVSFVLAKGLNSEYFGLDSNEEVPDTILTGGGSVAPFSVLAIQYMTADKMKLYKLFSNQPLSTNDVQLIFVNTTQFYMHYWNYTFPDLDPVISPNRYQPIQLADKFFYLNTIESVASAIEASTIAGRNVALWIASLLNAKD